MARVQEQAREALTDPPVCPCHGEPMTWQRDVRLTGDGYWRCRAKRREYNQRRAAQRSAWVQAKRDADPLYRIRDSLRVRHRQSLKRMAARNSTEEGSTS